MCTKPNRQQVATDPALPLSLSHTNVLTSTLTHACSFGCSKQLSATAAASTPVHEDVVGVEVPVCDALAVQRKQAAGNLHQVRRQCTAHTSTRAAPCHRAATQALCFDTVTVGCRHRTRSQRPHRHQHTPRRYDPNPRQAIPRNTTPHDGNMTQHKHAMTTPPMGQQRMQRKATP